MPKMEEMKTFVHEIRAIAPDVSGIRLQNVDVKKKEKTVVFSFICDKPVPEDIIDKIRDKCDKITPQCFVNIRVDVLKVVSDKESVEKAVRDFLRKEYTSIGYLLEKDDVTATFHDGMVKYTLRLLDDNLRYVESNGILDKITAYLQTRFCDRFVGECQLKEGEIDVSILKDEPVTHAEYIERRYIKVKNVVPMDETRNPTDLATYIEDATLAGAFVLCGKITRIIEKQTKNGKPFFIIDFTDKTGYATGMYFSKPATLDRVKSLVVGDAIIANCTQDYYNDKLSLKLDKINRCVFPEDFVPQRKKKKTAPQEYSVVFPFKDETVETIDMLTEKEELPECLVNNDFVVLDFETSGLEVGTDRITEIGAAKIEKGKITQLFQTLIDPKLKLSAKNISLTGITQEMVDGQPTFERVIGDFYKFCEGSVLVGHNILGFDIKMLEAQASPEGYYFENKIIDTYPLAMEVVKGLGNYKLNSIADKFGIEFHHHRALADAYATAQIFIKLIEIKKCLPDMG